MPNESLPKTQPTSGAGLRTAEKKAAVALSEVAARTENPGAEKGPELRDRAARAIKAIKGDLGGVKKLGAENPKKRLGWAKLAAEDDGRLLPGTLTREGARPRYRDDRIFDAKVPEHLLKVLRAGETRNARLAHFLLGELDHQDRDLALDMGSGFQTVGAHKVKGVWEAGPAKATPKKGDVREFHDSLKSPESMGEKPARVMDYIIDAVPLAI